MIDKSTTKTLPTDYQNFIHKSRYARWSEENQRREEWHETVQRYMDNVVSPVLAKTDITDRKRGVTETALYNAIVDLEVMPSMRCMMAAGDALRADNVTAYNCAYTPVDHPRCFDEILYILMCGTGVGFSVESKYTNSLPEVPDFLMDTATTIVVEDSRIGWADAYRQLLDELWSGRICKWDVSEVRPAGAKLKTMGGRASGPEPLVDLFKHTIEVFKGAEGRRLKPIEVHSIVTMIGQVVVVGGVRRSAQISLSDLHDKDMRDAKSGEWWVDNGHYALANNSAVYETTPSASEFLSEWGSLVASGSGERGIYNRAAAVSHAASGGVRDTGYEFGCNPCSEIQLRGQKIETYVDPETGKEASRGVVGTGGQFCNLTEVVVRADDTLDDLVTKVRLATILGTIQASLTYFPYLRDCWGHNTEEEALLGVSMTGVMDNTLTNGRCREDITKGLLEFRLDELRLTARAVNSHWSKVIGVNPAAAITTVKPSGTVSQLVDSASGLHTRHSKHYIRTVRGDNKDPLTQFMRDAGIPCEPCVMNPDSVSVFSFPMTAPEGCMTREDMSAEEQLEMWMTYQQHYTEHKPSVTISVMDDEWVSLGAMVYENFSVMSGVSFLPHSDHTYQQAPYQEVASAEDLAKVPTTSIDWGKLADYEREDNTTGSQELACSGGTCELVDLTQAAA